MTHQIENLLTDAIIEQKGNDCFRMSTSTYKIDEGENGFLKIITTFILKNNKWIFDSVDVKHMDLESNLQVCS